MRFTWSMVAAVAVLVGAGTGPAHATFPGANHHIAWTSIADPGTSAARTAIFVDTVPLSNPLPDENHTDPAWSADGSKLVFVSQSPSYGWRLEKMNADGTGRQVVLNVTQVGRGIPSSPVWSKDGKKIFFRAGPCNGNVSYCVYTIGHDGSGGLIENTSFGVESGIDVSSKNQLLYRFEHPLQPEPDVLWWAANGGNLHHITIPGQLGLPLVDAPVWMPDGETIVFRAIYSIMENGAAVGRTEWFKIRRDGTGLEQLTKAEDACPLPGLQPDFSFVGAAPSPDGDLIVLLGSKAVLQSFDNNTCTFRPTNGLWSIRSTRNPTAPPNTPTGGPPGMVHEDEHAQWRPSWQPNPASLILKIDDGRGNPLDHLKVQIYDFFAPPDSPPLNVVPQNTFGGSYAFDVPFGAYRVRATLLEDNLGISSFEIRHGAVPAEAVWLEKTILHQFGLPVPRFSYDSTAVASNLPEDERDHLDDVANIFFRMTQYVDWVRAHLTPTTGAPVRFYAYATTDLDSVQVLPADARYNSFHQAIFLGTATSSYADRDGSGQAESPENGEWHEFTHHLIETFIDHGLACGVNHGGYENANTCDSVREGFAAALPALASHAIDGTSDADYDSKGNLERDYKAWERKSSGGSAEDLAVAALLWDLLDINADVESSQVIGADGLHHPVTYQDTVTLSMEDLWDHLTSLGTTTATVYDLRQSFGILEPTRDLDGDSVADVAPLDEVFLMHGFFPIEGDQQITPTHDTYHFQVTGGVENDHVGRTDHSYFNANGTVSSSTGPRSRFPEDPSANLEIDVRDASGTPLAGATVRMRVDDAGSQSTMERRLDGGDAAPVHLELPAYFSYLLPVDATGLPACDPLNDDGVSVVLTASINGYDSADSFTFDSCAYWHAIEAATGPTALAFTINFPEDASAPVSAINASASVQPTNGGTTGYWTLELSCSDPVTDGFASGCHRTEYRLNGGVLTPYTKRIELVQPGQYVVEFRSIDGAANEEAFQSATFTVHPPPDSDGDGLSDDYEVSIGTSPNNPDTDGDGLRDDAELTRGTDPLVGDTDADGLSDGNEVSRGTNPLLADTDGDGLSDGAEVAAGLNPLVADMDGDTRLDGADNCVTVANRAQLDSDLDGRGELCDNCPGVANVDQADGDGDGAGNACDCAPADPLQRAPSSPTLLATKTGGSTLVLSWAPLVGADDYSVTVGTRTGVASGDLGTCVGSTGGLPSFQSAQVPAPGQVLTYLVQGQSYTCGLGSLGFGANEAPRINLGPAGCHPAQVVERRTLSGTTVLGTASGNHTLTHAADGVVLELAETLSSGGSPSLRFSRLEYRFTLDVAAAQRIQLVVKGVRSSLDGDDFRFEWSTNGTTYTPVPMDSLPLVGLDDGIPRIGDLPPTLSGSIVLRVVDTLRDPGTQGLDVVRIDSLLVRSITP